MIGEQSWKQAKQYGAEVMEPGTKSRPRLIGFFTALWMMWVVLILVVEFDLRAAWSNVGLSLAREPWVWLLMLFVVVEGLAVGIKKKGDTLSEHVWAFIHGAPARNALVMGVTFFLLLRMYEIGQEAPLRLGGLADVEIARAALVIGVGAWLASHFLKRGSEG